MTIHTHRHGETTCYLGDGAYADFDGYGIEVYASDGTVKTDKVYLEPTVLCSLIDFALRMGVIEPNKDK